MINIIKIISLALVIPLNLVAFETVPYVNLDKYLGQWYEIASYPNSFQSDCRKSSALYEKRKNYLKVTNSCTSIEKKNTKETVGRAWVVNKETNAQLKVQFFIPFIRLSFLAGDYQVILLDDKNYTYSVVSEPSMKYLWILSRSPEMDEDLYQEIRDELAIKGFDLTKLRKTNI